jgi:galactose mutarotase-like enzyme
MCGWDECAPTIVACSVNGIPLADHGELWTKAFSVKGENMTALDSTLGYEFSRRIQSTSDGLIMDYRVRAGQNDVPFLWAGHPQFRAPSGTRVLLPSSVKRVVDVMDLELPILDWSNEQGSIDTVEEGGYRKIYAHPDEFVSNAILMHSDGSALELAWTSACSFLGLWFDKFAFRKEAIIAIEPTTGYFDSLETAIKNRRVTNIAKGTELSWQIRIRSLA